jgi:copper chaperone
LNPGTFPCPDPLNSDEKEFRMQTEIIKIEGMTCMGCVNSVKNVLEKIPGVSSADVSLEQKQVTVEYDAAITNSNQFKDAIKGAGFEIAS